MRQVWQAAREKMRASGATPQRLAFGGVALAAAGAGVLALASGSLPKEPGAARLHGNVLERLKERLPQTQVTSVDCSEVKGLCEIVAGPNLFYTDEAARYLFIGRVYDLETRADVTAARLLELSPDTLARTGPRAEEAAPRREAQRWVDLASLPRTGAIRWGAEQGPRVVVFSDLACSYCRMLHQTLARLGVQVEEYPIAILGSRSQAEAVLCAQNPAAALSAHYSGQGQGAWPRKAACDTRTIETNQAFFEGQGWQGTPVLVRADGAVHFGALDAAALIAWLGERRA